VRNSASRDDWPIWHESGRAAVQSWSFLQRPLTAGADMLVSNDSHLLELNSYQGLRICSMTEYFNLLVREGHIVS
jgi:hypothetical protein